MGYSIIVWNYKLPINITPIKKPVYGVLTSGDNWVFTKYDPIDSENISLDDSTGINLTK